MGLFDFLSGTAKDTSKSKTEQEQTSGKIAATNSGSAQTSQGGSKEASSQKGTSSFRTLSPEAEAALQNSLLSASGTIEPADLGGARDIARSDQVFADNFKTRAAGGDAARTAEIDKIIAANRAKGEEALGSQLSILAQNLGGKGGSGYALTAGEGIRDLEVGLAGVEGQLRLDARDRGTDELLKSLSASGSVGDRLVGVNNAAVSSTASLAQVLKGAVGTEDKTATLQGEQLSSTNQIGQELTAGTEFTVADLLSNQEGEGTRGSSLLDFLNVGSKFV